MADVLPLPVHRETLPVSLSPQPRLLPQDRMHDATFALLCLQPLPPRVWWRLRSLSRDWWRLIDGHGESDDSLGLLPVLVNSLGPLDTANKEVDFAGCVYSATHHGSTSALREFLRPLASPSWARRIFARGVCREALIQASVSGSAECCTVLLNSHGPSSPLAAQAKLSCGRGRASETLGFADLEMAQREAEEWERASPGSVLPACRIAVNELLNSAMECCSEAVPAM